ncbi:MAG: response regulator [Duncaniella sp.]|nr:response regulator [Duncaniella sp.]
MSNNNVKTILKDKKGFLWVGTASGLNRYDGYGFRQYGLMSSTESIDDYLNDIWSLQEDYDGNIWVRGYKYYSVFNRDKDAFSVEVPKLLAGYGIEVTDNYCVYVDRSRNLWILTDNTIHFFDMSARKLKSIPHSIGTLYSNIGISDYSAGLYILMETGEIYTIDKSRLTIGHTDGPEGINSANHIYADYQHGLWLFSDHNDDIFYRKQSSRWVRLPLPSSSLTQSKGVRSILDDKSGHVLIGTDHNGLFIYSQSSGELESFVHDSMTPGTLPSNNVSYIYQDSDNTIWFGHNKSGISFCNDARLQFEDYGFFWSDDITALLVDHDGYLWAGTDGNGLYRKKADDKSRPEKISSVFNGSIICLDEDRRGTVSAGCYGNGIYRISRVGIQHFTKANSSLISDIVWDIQSDKNGNLWIATINGTQYLEPESGQFMSIVASDGLPISAMTLFYDGDDTMYVGAFDGFYSVNINTKRHEHHRSNNRKTQAFREGYISAILKDKSGQLWLGHNRGITVWNTESDSLYNITPQNGLCNNMVQSMAMNDDGSIWVSTSNGLSIISPRWGDDGEFGYTLRSYTGRHGLKSGFFNTNAIAKLPGDNLIFGTSNGCVTFFPKKIFNARRGDLQVIFTGLSVGARIIAVDSLYDGRVLLTKSLENTPSLTFDRDDNMITIGFTACDIMNQYNLGYQYKLEGLDNQWLSTTDNKVTFASIPAGKYRLLVKACYPDGECSEPVGIEIIVRPPFYLTWWAYCLYLLSAAMLIYIIYKNVRGRHRRKLAWQKQKIETEQKERINEIKLKFFTNISHDLRTPLTLIMVPLQVLMEQTKDVTVRKMLDTMHHNATHLLNLINSLLDLRKLDVGAEELHCSVSNFVSFIKSVCRAFDDYASSRNIRLTVESGLRELDFSYDQNKIKKVLNNLLSNAFKYTPDGGSVTVNISSDDSEVTVRVSDTGAGVDDETKKHIFERFFQGEQSEYKTGSGIGLHIASEYIHMHGGEISIADNNPVGSVFTFSIPIRSRASGGETGDPVSDDVPGESSLQLMADELNGHDGPDVGNRKPCILLVDDNMEYLEIISNILSDEYSVITADNGEKALEIIDKENIDLVVSDVMMPGIDGMELCRRIKSDIRRSHIPVILLTAKSAEEYRIEGFELGADDYIAKPFNYQLLKLRIAKFIELFERNHRIFRNHIEVEPSEITITSLDEKLVERAISIVEDHMDDTDFSVEILSQELALSRGYLYKKLMTITGKGPAEFIRTIRLKRARQLLAESQMQIAEVAYKCGFNSPKRFAQNFRNEFGMLPSEFLKGLS